MTGGRDSGGAFTVGAISLRDAAGLSPIATISLRDTSGLSTVYAGGASAPQILSPDYVAGYGSSSGAIPITTDQATVNAPSGATITWQFDPVGRWSATSPGATTTQFRCLGITPNQSQQTQVTALIRTSAGNSYTSNTIMAYVENTNSGGPNAQVQ